MSHSDSPKEIWSKAGRLANAGKNAHEAWTDLKSWALESNDPVAMKAAVFEFLAAYATSPEAAPLLPEVFRDAVHISSALPSQEREILIELAEKATTSVKLPSGARTEINPKKLDLNLPLAGNRPATEISVQPSKSAEILQPFKPSMNNQDLLKARDAMLNVNEGVLATQIAIRPPKGRPKKQQLEEVKSYNLPSNASYMSADKGDELVQSLIEKLKSHSSEATSKPRLLAPPVPEKKKAKKKAKAAPKKKKKTAKKKPAKKVKAVAKKKVAKNAAKQNKKKAVKKKTKKAAKKKPAKKKR